MSGKAADQDASVSMISTSEISAVDRLTSEWMAGVMRLPHGIGNGHGFDSILRGAMDFECQPCLDGGPDARRSVQALPGRTRNLSTTTLMQVKSIIQSLR